MTKKIINNEQTEQPKRTPLTVFSLLTLILLFAFGCLASYVWVHHQMLLKTETEMEKIQQAQAKYQINNETSASDQPTPSIVGHEHAPTKMDTDMEASFFQPTNPQKFIGFDKLIGFKEELTAAEGFLDYLQNKTNYQGIGEVEAPLGILMYGCPGTGKTTFARALAKETQLPFFEISSSLFSQKYKGVAPQMVKDLFEKAREVAEQNDGAIIFLDECETIFTDLGMLEAGSEIANVVNQFKTEMTSKENNPDKPIFIIGATNHLDQIDEAIRSRFTYNIEVKPGNKTEREQMFNFLIKKRKNPYSDEAKTYLYQVINEALERLPQDKAFLKANRTLENLLKTTASLFARQRGTGEQRRKEINKADLKQAYQLIISADIKVLEEIEKELTLKGGEQ
ncbi:MAG: ATP-binding protein [Vigna little leaf phytoplasma]|nr:ATP-binding protein [Vigna little leaf phytoplasma]